MYFCMYVRMYVSNYSKATLCIQTVLLLLHNHSLKKSMLLLMSYQKIADFVENPSKALVNEVSRIFHYCTIEG